MAVMRTYQGVVQKGRIRISPPFDLPEGSEVVVVATGRRSAETAVSNTFYTHPNRADMLQEQAAYQAMLPELLNVYKDQYIAMYHGEVIDHDTDRITLITRLDESYPDEIVLIKQVITEPDRILRMPSPRLVRSRS